MGPGEETQQLPRVVLRDPEPEEVRVLRAAQLLLLKHPVAGQAAFSALLEEGRRFAETPEGAEWRKRLEGASLIHRARLVWDCATLWMLEEDPPFRYPSAYLDALFRTAAGEGLELLLDELFQEAADPGESDG